MQISHQHNKIIYSQYGNHCRIDGFGDIPGQVVSALDLTIFWTTKSALVLVSGMSLLIVKKFPCAGLLMVREANGQNKSRFTPSMLGTIFLVMTVSHYYSACENILLRFQRPYFCMEKHHFIVAVSISITISVFFLRDCFEDYMHTSKLISRWQWSTDISSIRSIWQSFNKILHFSFNFFSCNFYFISRLIFPDLVDFPSDLNFQLSFPSHPIQLIRNDQHKIVRVQRTVSSVFFLFS